MSIDFLLVLFHLLAVALWLGGIIFIAAALVPEARKWQEPPGAGMAFLQRIALRFRPIAWAAILVLIGTGLAILARRGIEPDDFFTGGGWFVNTLRIKAGLIALILALGLLHDFLLGPRLFRQLEQARHSESVPTASLKNKRKVLSWLARLNVLLGLAVVVLGVVLANGLPY